MSSISSKNNSSTNSDSPNRLNLINRFGSHTVGAALLVFTAFVFVVCNHLTQIVDSPMLVTYFNTSLSSGYLLLFFIKKGFTTAISELRCDNNAKTSDNNSADSSNESPQTSRRTLFLSLCFFPLWFSMAISFNWSLSNTSMASNTIISSLSSLFALSFSWLLINSPIRFLNCFGAALSITGASIVTFADSTNSEAHGMVLWGNFAAAFSAFLSGYYGTMVKKQLVRADMTLFIGGIGASTLLLMWPAVLISHLMGWESLQAMSFNQFLMVLANGILTVVSNYTFAKAIVLTSPIMALVGLGLTTPFSLIDDIFINHKPFSTQYFIGAIVVMAGVFVTNFQHHSDKEIENDKKGKSIAVNRKHESEDESRDQLTNDQSKTEASNRVAGVV